MGEDMENHVPTHDLRRLALSVIIATLRILGTFCCLFLSIVGLLAVVDGVILIGWYVPHHSYGHDLPGDYYNAVVFTVIGLGMLIFSLRWLKTFIAKKRSVTASKKETPLPDRGSMDGPPGPTVSVSGGRMRLFRVLLCLFVGPFLILYTCKVKALLSVGQEDPIGNKFQAGRAGVLPTLFGCLMVVYASSRLLQRLEGLRDRNRSVAAIPKETPPSDG